MSGWLDIFNGTPVRKVEKGAAVFRQEDRVQSMYLVRSGAVALERPMKDGVPLTLHVATTDMALAEASLFADTYHCDAVARSDAEVASLSRTAFLAAIRDCPDAAGRLAGPPRRTGQRRMEKRGRADRRICTSIVSRAGQPARFTPKS